MRAIFKLCMEKYREFNYMVGRRELKIEQNY